MSIRSEGYKDGAITYFEEASDVIVEATTKRGDGIAMLMKQYLQNKKSFVNESRKFEDLRKKTEDDLKEKLLSEYRMSKDEATRSRIISVISALEANHAGLFEQAEIDELRADAEKKKAEEIESAENTDSDSGENADDKKKDIEEKAEEKEVAAGSDGNEAYSSENAEEQERDIVAEDVAELEEKAHEMEEMKKAFEATDVKSKTNFISSCVSAKIIIEARAAYEVAQDEYRMKMAKHIIDKNILVAQREAVINEDIAGAIASGEDVSKYEFRFIALDNQINALDREFEIEHKRLLGNITNAFEGLKNAKHSVETNIKTDIEKLHRERTYDKYSGEIPSDTDVAKKSVGNAGVLKADEMHLTKNNAKIALRNCYNNLLETGNEQDAITTRAINYNGKTIVTQTKEHAGGVDTAFIKDGVQYAGTRLGDVNRVQRDEDWDVAADDPELKESLRRLGVKSVNDIPDACTEIEEAAEKNEGKENANDKNKEEEFEPLPGQPRPGETYYSNY